VKEKPTQTSGVNRLEAFSDAVLAIVLTLLVLELLPEGAQTPAELLGKWPTYLAFLTAFLTVGVVWLNHNGAIARIRRADPRVQVLNLGILLGASLMPWPTSLISAALQNGERADQIAAIFVFALVTVLISVPWLALDLYLIRHPALLTSPADLPRIRRHATSSIGTLVAAGLSIALAFVSPLASLVLYAIVVAVFLAARLRSGEASRGGVDETD
jgi:uncharacterized membrane protein